MATSPLRRSRGCLLHRSVRKVPRCVRWDLVLLLCARASFVRLRVMLVGLVSYPAARESALQHQRGARRVQRATADALAASEQELHDALAVCLRPEQQQLLLLCTRATVWFGL